MKAAVFRSSQSRNGSFLDIEDVPRPQAKPGFVLLRVVACGVCRTDLHIVEGDLPRPAVPRIPGHQTVGEVVEGETDELPIGTRVGVSWMGGVDGDCWYCRHDMEHLFSGTATYQADVVAPTSGKGDRIWLRFSDVHEIAHVTINGKDVGTVCAEPLMLRVDKFLKPAENHL